MYCGDSKWSSSVKATSAFSSAIGAKFCARIMEQCSHAITRRTWEAAHKGIFAEAKSLIWLARSPYARPAAEIGLRLACTRQPVCRMR